MPTRTSKRTGEVQELVNGQWVTIVPPQEGVTIAPAPPDPSKVRAESREEERLRLAREAAERDARGEGRAERGEERSERGEARDITNDRFSHVTKLAGDYNADPSVKAYRVAISQLGQALQTGRGPQADLALTYAFAKAMDPESVVRESEQGMVTSSQPWFQAAVENVKKQFGMDNAGSFTPEAREALRRQIANSVAQRVKVYDARRDYYTKQAKTLGVDPGLVIGEHDAKPFIPVLQEWGKRRSTVGNTDPEMSRAIDRMVREGRSFDEANAFVKEKNWTPIKPEQYQAAVAHFKANPDTKESYGAALYKPDSTDYTQSVAGQALSGINEGIASVVGAPVDLAAGTLNLIPRGLNALANTNLPTIVKPILGSDWIKGYLQRIGSINEPASTPGLRTVRRVGESVGAAAIPAGFSGSLARAAGQLVAGAGGGAGAAAAQQAFPGNTIAELAGEVAGGGFTGSALASAARRNAQRSMAAQVPTIPQLKQQAGELYRQAEARGVVADPVATRELADNMRAALTQEGRISPTGRISEVYPKAREGMQLVEDYAGQPMTPTQMQTVRKVATDGLTSSDSSERRLAGILTDVIDQWANPRAPELAEARDVASRYLTAEQLEKARELAGARVGQFTGSGFENALRTEYRALDRGAIRGSKRFGDDALAAIERVARGTPTSNFFRNMGRFAPTGPMSTALTGGGGAGIAMLSGASPTVGLLAGAAAGGLGHLGRKVATNMGVAAADNAELVARNGGALPKIPALTPEVMQAMNALVAAEAAKYLTRKQDQQHRPR